MLAPEMILPKFPADDPLSPVLLEPILVERIWGTKDLMPWYTATVQSDPVGEIWLTAETCRVKQGPWAGQTLAEITSAHPSQFGDPDRQGFPLLIKLLFPREKLSVQVHPDDAHAQAQGMPRGKTECWLILSAEPGAQVAVGFKDPLNHAELKAAIEDGSLEDKLRMLPVQAGDMVFIDAGTVHAIGPGMVVLETQQYSDTTYRLWDYGRPRELHVGQGTAVTRADTAAGRVAPTALDGYTRLVSCEYFAVDRFRLEQDQQAGLAMEDKLQILVALSGSLALKTEGAAEISLPRGQAVVLPTSSARTLRANATSEVIRIVQP